MYLISFVRFCWAFPCTFGGLLLALLGRSQVLGLYRDALVVRPRARVFLWFYRRFHVGAFTWGQVILLAPKYGMGDGWLLTHEHVHTRQAQRWGPLFPFAYGVCSLIALGGGGKAYADNAFEVEAEQDEQRYWAMRLP